MDSSPLAIGGGGGCGLAEYDNFHVFILRNRKLVPNLLLHLRPVVNVSLE